MISNDVNFASRRDAVLSARLPGAKGRMSRPTDWRIRRALHASACHGETFLGQHLVDAIVLGQDVLEVPTSDRYRKLGQRLQERNKVRVWPTRRRSPWQTIGEPTVAAFCDWLSERLQGQSIDFPHAGSPTYPRLHDALGHYAWPDRRRAGLPKPGHPYRLPVLPALAGGSSFAQNEQVLQRLQKVLRRAYHHRPVNPTRLGGVVAAIFYWGGVYAEHRPGQGNKGWLAAQGSGLLATLQAVEAQVRSGGDVYAGALPLYFTAGTTKVYSLLLDDFIIYDSRVASALAWLTLRWWTTRSGSSASSSTLPRTLRFVCLPRNGRAASACCGRPKIDQLIGTVPTEN